MDFVIFVEAVLGVVLLIGFVLSRQAGRWAVLDYGVFGLAILGGVFALSQSDTLGLTWALIPLTGLISLAGACAVRTFMGSRRPR
jgi:hypothetical protein